MGQAAVGKDCNGHEGGHEGSHNDDYEVTRTLSLTCAPGGRWFWWRATTSSSGTRRRGEAWQASWTGRGSSRARLLTSALASLLGAPCTLHPTPYTLHPAPQAVSSSTDLIRASVYATYSGSMTFTTHLDHISHCEIASSTNWLNRWTYRLFMINTQRN